MSEQLERIARDYADQTRICWASDSGQALSECWCAQCAEGRFWYSTAVQALADKRELEFWKDAAEQNKAKLAKIENFLQASIDNGEWEEHELEEPFWEQLADLANLTILQAMDVRVIVTYTGTISVPRGTDISEIDTGENFPWSIQLRHGGHVLADQELTYDDLEIEEE